MRSSSVCAMHSRDRVCIWKDSSGCVAQLVEQLTLNQWVQGSSPCASTRNKRPFVWPFFCVGPSGREPVKGFGTPVGKNKRMRCSRHT